MAIKQSTHLTPKRQIQYMLGTGSTPREVYDSVCEDYKKLIRLPENPRTRTEINFLEACLKEIRMYMSSLQDKAVAEETSLNSLQYAHHTTATTVGELISMLLQLESKWTEQDIAYLGEFRDQPIAMDSDKGIHSQCKAQYCAAFGLIISEGDKS